MFHSARIKLTAWYLLIITLISVSFSLAIYEVLTFEVERFDQAQRYKIQRRLEEGWNPYSLGNSTHVPLQIYINTSELIAETKQRIIYMLFLINGTIIIISGGLGYILAGRTLKPIQEMVNEQNRFISDASHELRTPLTSLKSAFEVYLRNQKPTLTEAKTLARESVLEVNKLQSLSDSLLQLAQYQKPNGHSNFETLSLNQTLKEAIHKMIPIAHNKQVAIEYKPVDIDIVGNKYGLIDLFVILLDNAVKYSPSKTKILVSVKKTEHEVFIQVKDEGVGIKKKDMPYIFDRFYRADSTRSEATGGGYGLGLSIAKKIASVHKGTISVESQSGKGAVFIVRLPIHTIKVN